MTYPVAIIGAGPVGLTLALDLASRGIGTILLEQRRAYEVPSVKCNHISSRTMEIFRRLGIVVPIRNAGLPGDYPNDVVVRTRATGFELTRIPIPCREQRYTATGGPDTDWPTPEPAHRINQIYFEPLLFQRAAETDGIEILNRTRYESCTQHDDRVVVTARDLETQREITLECEYLIGCDGGRSEVRRQIGAKLQGDDVIQRVQSTYFRAPDLIHRIPKPAWMSYLYAPERAGNLVAIDGQERWLLHNYLLPHEPDFESVDRDQAIRCLLGVDASFEYELLAREDWVGRRLIASTFRDRRVFICGDAAHLWVGDEGTQAGGALEILNGQEFRVAGMKLEAASSAKTVVRRFHEFVVFPANTSHIEKTHAAHVFVNGPVVFDGHESGPLVAKAVELIA